MLEPQPANFLPFRTPKFLLATGFFIHINASKGKNVFLCNHLHASISMPPQRIDRLLEKKKQMLVPKQKIIKYKKKEKNTFFFLNLKIILISSESRSPNSPSLSTLNLTILPLQYFSVVSSSFWLFWCQSSHLLLLLTISHKLLVVQSHSFAIIRCGAWTISKFRRSPLSKIEASEKPLRNFQ